MLLVIQSHLVHFGLDSFVIVLIFFKGHLNIRTTGAINILSMGHIDNKWAWGQMYLWDTTPVRGLPSLRPQQTFLRRVLFIEHAPSIVEWVLRYTFTSCCLTSGTAQNIVDTSQLGIFEWQSVLVLHTGCLVGKEVHEWDRGEEADYRIDGVKADAEKDREKIGIKEHLENATDDQVEVMDTEYERDGDDPENY